MAKIESGSGKESTSQNKWKRLRDRFTVGIAGITAISLIGSAVAYKSKQEYGSYIPPWLNPFSSTLYLPDDPCTQLQPFSTDRSSKKH
jgi:hypothetical protein